MTHVAWAASLRPHATRPRPTVRSLRTAVSGRLFLFPRFRRRIVTDPLGVAESRWIDDVDFDIRRHVVRLGRADEVLSRERFAELCDAVLSKPLHRGHPPWELYLAPRLEDGGVGLVCKVDSALADGAPAADLATLLFDADPHAAIPEPVEWEPAPEPSAVRLTLEALGPRSVGNRIGDTLRRTALRVGDDLLRPAPSSFLNAELGPRRTLQHARLARAQVERVRAHCGATIADVCLTVVAGALRELSLERSRPPIGLKAMLPAGGDECFALVDLPVEVFSPLRRLDAVQRQTRSIRMRERAARAIASRRAYNLVVARIDGPPGPLYMLGAELEEAYPAMPLSDKHALSIGVFAHGAHLFFGVHADPDVLPDAIHLGGAIATSFRSLERALTKGPVRGVRRSTLAPWPSTSPKTSSRARSSTSRRTFRSSSTSGPPGADHAGS